MNFCLVPYVYTLEITSRCNANCVGCGNVFPHGNLYMEPERLRIALDRISPYAEMLRVTGGEPTLSPVFGEIVWLVDGLGRPFVVFTNGLWRDPLSIVDVLRRCRNLDGILVSLHGHTASAFKAFTGGDHLWTVVANVQRASDAGITVNTNTILTHQNIDHMAAVVELATGSGAQVVAFSRYYGAPVPGVTDLSADQFRSAVEQVAGFRADGKSVKFNNNIPLCVGGELTQACPAGDTHCTISPAYKVRICNHSPYEVGDILETGIVEIWQSERVRWWREQIPTMCRQCAAFDLCRGGCRANAAANGLATDPLACRPYQAVPGVSTVRHSLPGESFPRARFSLREESFGYVLINRSQILKLSSEAMPFINALVDGNMTLSQIGDCFGHEVLNLVGLLYDRRMVELASEVPLPQQAGQG
jgi:radical SAM protein with 4Fe4S-binding SPASM domain